MSPLDSSPRRILLIDDNESIHEDFRKLFENSAPAPAAADQLAALILDERPAQVAPVRFTVDCVFTGAAGLARLQEELQQGRQYTVAFVDVRLGAGWDGLETTERLWQADPHLQVILCTAYSAYSWRDLFERFQRCDQLVILKKPFDAVEALQLATALSEKWRLEGEARRRVAHLEKTIDDQQHNRALAEAQFSAVLAERNRLAREIHDTLAQGFASILLQLESVKDTLADEPETARRHAQRACELARENLEQTRRTIWNIRSQALESGDLASALAEFGRSLTAEGPVAFSFESAGARRRLSAAVEDHLLRIGQEAINNALKHSDARRITARLEFLTNAVRLEVRDDGAGDSGSGFAPKSGSYGLLGMEERAKEMGGKLLIQSEPGRGVLVSVTVPGD